MLKEYEKLAQQLIVKHIGKANLNSDTIDYVTRSLLQSHFKYDPTKGASLKTYLYRRSYFACMKVLRNSRTRSKEVDFTTLSAKINDVDVKFENTIPDREYANYDVVDYILNSKFLSEQDADILSMIYIEGKNQADCAEKYGVSRQAISQRLEKILLTLKICYKSKEHLLNIVGE